MKIGRVSAILESAESGYWWELSELSPSSRPGHGQSREIALSRRVWLVLVKTVALSYVAASADCPDLERAEIGIGAGSGVVVE